LGAKQLLGDIFEEQGVWEIYPWSNSLCYLFERLAIRRNAKWSDFLQTMVVSIGGTFMGQSPHSFCKPWCL